MHDKGFMLDYGLRHSLNYLYKVLCDLANSCKYSLVTCSCSRVVPEYLVLGFNIYGIGSYLGLGLIYLS